MECNNKTKGYLYSRQDCRKREELIAIVTLLSVIIAIVTFIEVLHIKWRGASNSTVGGTFKRYSNIPPCSKELASWAWAKVKLLC